ncbi:hypothetical protein SAMN05444817_103189 [Corynebacterium appendicis CIP 107643]|uniref:Or membrane protein n=1 Tax=Corynebacterium appendicis CIP 107643 TaxID=1161099 RepID=A0A1N7J2D8_9CORY|nr:hypothetical protein [Corynebacterium appendicis]WJY61383.1 hypothetical protein CAPP_07360 [Corynebacterium appendicis CIP 107643]SIS43464.1 hypothetical protein SAMN05444817_103189 [Corynebacterium appendicis CIP 107643]
MRKFRNAALAAVTASAVAFGGTAVATADTQPDESRGYFTSGSSQDGDTPIKDLIGAIGKGPGLGGVGDKTDADTEADLRDAFGDETYDENLPQWMRLWRDSIDWFALGTIVAGVVGAANWALYNGYLPQIDWKTMTLK